jgi:hypothetical protein
MFIDPKNKKKMIGPSQKSTVPAGFYRQITCYLHFFRTIDPFIIQIFTEPKKNRQVPLFPVKTVCRCFTGQIPPAELNNALLKGHIINFSKITNYGKH